MGKKTGDGAVQGESLNTTLERAKAEWEAAFDSISEGLLFVDPDGRVKRANRALATLLGRDVRQLAGLTCCDLFNHHKAHDDACPVRSYPEGNKGTFEVFFPEYRYHEETVHPIIRAGKQQGFVIAVRDITLEQMAIEERKHLHLEIEEAARKRHQAKDALQALKTELAEVEQTAALGRLAAVLFAELDRSLRMVHDGLALLAERYAEKTVDESGEIDSILRDLKTVAARDMEILGKLSALHPGEAQSSEQMDLNQLVEAVLKDVQSEAAEHGVSVKFEAGELPPLFGSQAQILAVISGVIRNALEATKPAHGSLEVVTSLDRKFARLEVRDTGGGIAPAHLAQVFNPFFTTDPNGHKTGLGLTICQTLVQGHRGHIEVSSSPDEGTTVSCYLPVNNSD